MNTEARKQVKESTVEDAVDREAARYDGTTRKFTTPGRRGVVDRLVILPGGVVGFIECKRPVGGKLSALQKREIDSLRSYGLRVAVVSTVSEAAFVIREWAIEGLIVQAAAYRIVSPKEAA
jgi:hypothetical protein